jgi:hypothetical protein
VIEKETSILTADNLPYRVWHSAILQVKRFIAIETGQQVDLKTKLESELGLTGDKAWLFMERFGKVFEVDMEEFRYNFLKYFRPNPNYISLLTLHLLFEIPMDALKYLFGLGHAQPRAENLFDIKIFELTVGDLVTCVVYRRFICKKSG